MKHSEKSEYADRKFKVKEDAISIGNTTIIIEDWWDRVYGKTWQNSQDTPSAVMYKIRKQASEGQEVEIPNNDEVLFGRIQDSDFPEGQGQLIHVNELGEEIKNGKDDKEEKTEENSEEN